MSEGSRWVGRWEMSGRDFISLYSPHLQFLFRSEISPPPLSLSISLSLHLPLSLSAVMGGAPARRPRAGRARGRWPAAISGGVARGGSAEVFQQPSRFFFSSLSIPILFWPMTRWVGVFVFILFLQNIWWSHEFNWLHLLLGIWNFYIQSWYSFADSLR